MSKKSYQILPQSLWDDMRARYGAGEAVSMLARQYGVSQAGVYKRLHKEGWTRNDCITVDDAPGIDAALASVEAVVGQAEQEIASERPARPPVEVETVEAMPLGAEPSAMGAIINEAHLEAASKLRQRIELLLHQPDYGGPENRQATTLKDLTLALERVQKIERQAIGLDHLQPTTEIKAIVIIPEKLDHEEWGRRAQDTLAGTSKGGS